MVTRLRLAAARRCTVVTFLRAGYLIWLIRTPELSEYVCVFQDYLSLSVTMRLTTTQQHSIPSNTLRAAS